MFGTAPAFWWRTAPALEARLLWPAGLAYGALAARRMSRSGVVLPVPVLCVGNFTAGGAGKTPTALELARRLRARGERPAFLSRGHGRTIRTEAAVAVEVTRHGAAEVGDEPLLLAREAPTFVDADRLRGARAALRDGATILIMDDGLQNPGLRKTAAIVVADGATGIGNGLCIPAGPLRAPLRAQWRATSLLCVIGPGSAGEALAAEALRRHVAVVRAGLEPDPAAREALLGRRLLAFSGIGRPEKFFDTLRSCGLDVVGTRAFADHHTFAASERRALLVEAQRSRAELVTTEKDLMRLPAGFATHVLPVRLVFPDGAPAIEALLDRLLGVSRDGS